MFLIFFFQVGIIRDWLILTLKKLNMLHIVQLANILICDFLGLICHLWNIVTLINNLRLAYQIDLLWLNGYVISIEYLLLLCNHIYILTLILQIYWSSNMLIHIHIFVVLLLLICVGNSHIILDVIVSVIVIMLILLWWWDVYLVKIWVIKMTFKFFALGHTFSWWGTAISQW